MSKQDIEISDFELGLIEGMEALIDIDETKWTESKIQILPVLLILQSTRNCWKDSMPHFLAWLRKK